MRLRLFALCLALGCGFVLACDRSPAAPTNPNTPATAAIASDLTANAATASAPGRQNVLVNMLDACDPETFNAVLGPGGCVRNGGMKFQQFTSLLSQLQFVGPWHFAPQHANVTVGQTFVARNLGGEEHTFTEVSEFGGGIVPSLNQLGGFGATVPECSTLDEDDLVAPGGSYTEEVEHSGTLKFQCCIHPWMRLEARASSR